MRMPYLGQLSDDKPTSKFSIGPDGQFSTSSLLGLSSWQRETSNRYHHHVIRERATSRIWPRKDTEKWPLALMPDVEAAASPGMDS